MPDETTPLDLTDLENEAGRQLPGTEEETPAAADDASPAPAPATDQDAHEASRRPTGRLVIGEQTKGRYVVLWARKPAKSDDQRPTWQEVDVVSASTPQAAKRAVMADGAPFAEFLRHSASQKPGILLRAVPAMHWPDDIKPTTYTRPAPVLEIG